MKIISAFFVASFALCAAGVWAEPTAAPILRRDASDFEIFMEKLGGKFPFPPEKILAQLGADHTAGAVIPSGMSPEARETGYHQPRTVFAWVGQDPARDGTPTIVFVGYVPKAHELQIISYNQRTGETEFRRVQDYGPNLQPRLDLPERAACLACHQHQAAIFPPFGSGWKQTQNNPLVRKKLDETLNLDSLAKAFLARTPPAAMNASEPDSQVNRFDKAVNFFNEITNLQRSCQTICGSQIECKRDIVASALLGDRTELYMRYFTDERLQKYRSLTSKKDFPFFNGSIADNAPDAAGNFSLSALHTSPFMSVPTNATASISMEIIAGPSQGKLCVGLTQADRKWINSLSYEKVQGILQSPEMNELLAKKGMINGTSLMNLIEKSLDAEARFCVNQEEKDKAIPFRMIADLHQKIRVQKFLEEDRKTFVTSSDPHKLFQHYCMRCHNDSEIDAPALPFKNLKDLASYQGRFGISPAAMLHSKSMPPREADQPSAQELELMLGALEASK
jgi:hypothetical protein